jgi:hypothetical protein
MSDPNGTQSQAHDETARDMIERIKAIVRERFQNLVDGSPRSRRRLVGVASVPDEFLEEVSAAIDNTPEAGVMNRITSAEARDMIVYSRVFEAFARQLGRLGRSVSFTVAEQRHDVAQRALGVYGTLKSANRPDRSFDALSSATPLKRALGRGGPRKQKAGPPPDPEPEKKT